LCGQLSSICKGKELRLLMRTAIPTMQTVKTESEGNRVSKGQRV